MTNKRISWWKGKKLSEEHRERIRQGMTGKKNMLGHTHKKETNGITLCNECHNKHKKKG